MSNTKLIEIIPFMANGVLQASSNSNSKCPNCDSKWIACHFDNHASRIYCTECFWEENYKRIVKDK